MDSVDRFVKSYNRKVALREGVMGDMSNIVAKAVGFILKAVTRFAPGSTDQRVILTSQIMGAIEEIMEQSEVGE